MELQEAKSAVREWLGDPSPDQITDSTIMFFVLSALDFYGAQLLNAKKGSIEKSVTKTVTTKTTSFSEQFAFGQAGYVRRKVSGLDAEKAWNDVDICAGPADLNEAERGGRHAVFFAGNKMILSWTPTEPVTLEIWGQRVLFTNLAMSETIPDVPGLFHHLVVEQASKRAITRLLKFPDLVVFARATQNDLMESIERREIIWRKYLAASPDEKRRHETERYSPLRDEYYGDWW